MMYIFHFIINICVVDIYLKHKIYYTEHLV